jgi:hypothetical protein
LDTIGLTLRSDVVPNIDLMAEIPLHLTSITYDGLSYDKPTVNGKYYNFDVSINENRIKISNASLTKFILGNSLSMMDRSSTKQAIEKMSDDLHLPIEKADVNKFHYAKNIMLKNDVSLYLPYLGKSGRYKRLEQPNGIYYKITGKEVVIYDKIKETKQNREPMHPMYNDRFMMRIESRFNHNLCKHFNRASITASTLYDENFYMMVNDEWYKDYLSIDKIKTTKIDMQKVRTKEQYKLLGVLLLVNEQGGKVQAFQNIKEMYLKKELTKKQYYDLRGLIEQSSSSKLQTIDSDLMIELNQKVKESVRYYR